MSKITNKERAELMRQTYRTLELIGEDPERDGLKKTPYRVAEALKFLTSGYSQNPRKVLNTALFDATCDEMVLLKNIDFYSLCEHHLLPFFGKCHIAYLPNKKVIGLSKLPRLVDVFARRLQIQESLTHQIAHTIQELTQAKGVGVIMEGEHLCMMMRGVERQNAYAVTSAMLGLFRDDARTRNEFLDLIHHRRSET